MSFCRRVGSATHLFQPAAQAERALGIAMPQLSQDLIIDRMRPEDIGDQLFKLVDTQVGIGAWCVHPRRA